MIRKHLAANRQVIMQTKWLYAVIIIFTIIIMVDRGWNAIGDTGLHIHMVLRKMAFPNMHSTLNTALQSMSCGVFTQSPLHIIRASAGVVFFFCLCKMLFCFSWKKNNKKWAVSTILKSHLKIVRFGSIFCVLTSEALDPSWTRTYRKGNILFYQICVDVCLRSFMYLSTAFAPAGFCIKSYDVVQLKEINW